MNQRGQVYPLFAFFLIALIGFSALSVDVGYYRYQQRQQQIAADTAAISGVAESTNDSSTDCSNANAAAKADAATNGFTDGTASVVVSPDPGYHDNYTSNGLASGCWTAGQGFKVSITKPYSRFFSGFFPGARQQSITTSAVAVSENSASNPCIVALGDTKTGATVTIDDTLNGVKIQAPNCGIANNGDTTCNGGTYNLASFAVNSAASTDCHPSSGATPVPSGPIPDPCSGYTGCNYIQQNCTFTSSTISCKDGTPFGSCGAASGTVNTPVAGSCYNAATFIGASKGKGKGNSTLNFPSGVYVLENGATFQGTITGTGVTFFVLNSAAGGTTIDMSQSGASIQLTAPTSGDFEQVLFYQPTQNVVPTCSSSGTTNCVDIKATMGTSCGSGVTGIWYMPNASFHFDGHSECFTGAIISDDVTIDGGANLTLNPPTGGTPGLTFTHAFLVE